MLFNKVNFNGLKYFYTLFQNFTFKIKNVFIGFEKN